PPGSPRAGGRRNRFRLHEAPGGRCGTQAGCQVRPDTGPEAGRGPAVRGAQADARTDPVVRGAQAGRPATDTGRQARRADPEAGRRASDPRTEARGGLASRPRPTAGGPEAGSQGAPCRKQPLLERDHARAAPTERSSPAVGAVAPPGTGSGRPPSPAALRRRGAERPPPEPEQHALAAEPRPDAGPGVAPAGPRSAGWTRRTSRRRRLPPGWRRPSGRLPGPVRRRSWPRRCRGRVRPSRWGTASWTQIEAAEASGIRLDAGPRGRRCPARGRSWAGPAAGTGRL